MEEELILKQKYNSLLESLKKGEDYISKNPEDEKAQKRMEEISEEMKRIMALFPDMTPYEMQNGFEIVIPDETPQEIPNNQLIKKDDNNILNNFDSNWSIAEKISTSSLLPSEFQGKPENVIIALGMSQKMGIDFYTIAQNLHLVRGRLTWSGSFCKTLIEKTGQYKDLDLVYIGEEGKDNRGCYLEATRIRDNKRIKGTTVTVALAKKEGWWTRKDKNGKETSKWSTMTEQMLGYRAMAFFARLYTPEALNGVMTSEESLDINSSRQQPQDIL